VFNLCHTIATADGVRALVEDNLTTVRALGVLVVLASEGSHLDCEGVVLIHPREPNIVVGVLRLAGIVGQPVEPARIVGVVAQR